jgi:hypothetical protein
LRGLQPRFSSILHDSSAFPPMQCYLTTQPQPPKRVSTKMLQPQFKGSYRSPFFSLVVFSIERLSARVRKSNTLILEIRSIGHKNNRIQKFV